MHVDNGCLGSRKGTADFILSKLRALLKQVSQSQRVHDLADNSESVCYSLAMESQKRSEGYPSTIPFGFFWGLSSEGAGLP